MHSENRIESVEWVRGQLLSWLREDTWEPHRIAGWLQGYDLPPIGHDDEPYLWLLRSIPVDERRSWAETELARRLASFLETQLDSVRAKRRWEQLVYNLLLLCAGLGCPDQLGECLYRVFQRGKLVGSWLGVGLRDCLRMAIIQNQLDRRFQQLWEAMLAKRDVSTLPGNEYDGFEGIRLMPPSAAERGHPALDAIGKALRQMARNLEDSTDRRMELQSLIGDVVATYPGRPSWDRDLVELADEHEWPRWALLCLPRLSLPLDAQPEGQLELFLLWRPVFEVIRTNDSLYTVFRKLCDGEVLLVGLTGQARAQVGFIMDGLEYERLHNPYPSWRSMTGVVAHVYQDTELRAKDAHPQIAQSIKEARERLLEEEAVTLA